MEARHHPARSLEEAGVEGRSVEVAAGFWGQWSWPRHMQEPGAVCQSPVFCLWFKQCFGPFEGEFSLVGVMLGGKDSGNPVEEGMLDISDTVPVAACAAMAQASNQNG